MLLILSERDKDQMELDIAKFGVQLQLNNCYLHEWEPPLSWQIERRFLLQTVDSGTNKNNKALILLWFKASVSKL